MSRSKAKRPAWQLVLEDLADRADREGWRRDKLTAAIRALARMTRVQPGVTP